MRKLALLVPAHNEEKVIAETLESLLLISSPEDIYVISDGSTDQTVEIAKRYTYNVFNLQPNRGKAGAMNFAIEFWQFALRYQYVMPMDADTKVTKDFLEAAMPILDQDLDKKISAVVGKVIGSSRSWVTTFRLWEYEVAQTIHKAAQSEENAIIVCPGCATIYRTEIFKEIDIPTGTLTEDMDFTFQIHRRKLGKIVYTGKAVVVTQDPLTLKDLLKQIDRWYTGFWQCVIKNNIPWGGQALDAEVGLLASEGLFNGMLVVSLIVLVPIAIVKHPEILFIPLIVDLLFFLLPTMFLTAKRHRSWKIFIYTPLFYFARILCCLVFLKSFVKTVFGLDLGMGWNKATRYEVIG